MPPGGPRGGKNLQKAKNFKKAWSRLLGFCKPYLPITIIAFVFAIGAVILQLIGPKKLGRMFTSMLFNNYSEVVKIGTFLAIMYAIMFVLNYANHFIMATVTQKIGKRLRTSLSKKINKLPFEYYDKANTGDILSRITNDADTVASTLNTGVVSLISQTVLFLGAMAFMFWTNWILALVAIGASLIGFALMGIIVKNSQKYFIQQQKTLGQINGHIEECYGGHSVIKACNARAGVNKTFDDINGKLYGSAWKSQFLSGLMMPLMGFISQLGFVSVMVVGGALAFKGTIGFEVIVSFMLYIRFFTQPLSSLAQAAQQLQSTAAAAERVFDFLEEKELADESALTAVVPAVKGSINFDGVKFGYTKDKTIIKGFDADIKPGSKVAIVGPTGAGKTTLVNLLMKFYLIDGGDIRIDGVSINDMRRENVHSLFGMVLQDTWLFEGTVRENLVYNVQGITQEQLDAACHAVDLDHFIKTLSHGYDTILDEQASISNGQRQLITIARAMLKNAPLLILDEATSSVDTRTELQIQAAMDKLTRGRTSFVIAHRLSTIKNADIILVMKDGDIVEKGTHDGLLKQKGFYADLYNSQFAV